MFCAEASNFSFASACFCECLLRPFSTSAIAIAPTQPVLGTYICFLQVASLATYSFFVFCLFGRQNMDAENEFDTVFPLFTVVQFLFYVGWYKVCW